MRRFQELYSPIEPRTEEEIKEWIRQHRLSPAGSGQSAKRIVSRHVSKMRNIHVLRDNPYLKGGYTGDEYGHGKSYFWIGLVNSDRMFNVGWDID